jgi:peptidoglycan/LPS O-acetylase OafA/YrhL
MAKTIFPSINGLRAISILIVIIYHIALSNPSFELGHVNYIVNNLYDFITDGQLGVNIFFVISGFLITSILLWEENETNDISLKNFYIKRFLRILPAYYFLLFVYFILQEFKFITISPVSWITSLTFTKYFNWNKDWVTAHAWTLSIEENFYLIWPLIFLMKTQLRKWFCLFLIIAVPLVRIVIYNHPISWIDELSIFTRIDAIATGCLFALYKDKIILKLSKHWKKYFYSAVILLIFLNDIPYQLNDLGLSKLNIFFIPFGLTHGTIANFIIGIILFYSIFGPKGIWFKFLNHKILNFIGLISFSLYLWQQILVEESTVWVTQFPQNIIFIFITAICSYYFIEKPFLSLKSKLVK